MRPWPRTLPPTPRSVMFSIPFGHRVADKRGTDLLVSELSARSGRRSMYFRTESNADFLPSALSGLIRIEAPFSRT